jgi:hypothetical protein
VFICGLFLNRKSWQIKYNAGQEIWFTDENRFDKNSFAVTLK